MGLNTSLVVLNDALDNIKNDPKFGEKVFYACLNVSPTNPNIDVSAGSFANAAVVAETHHSSAYRVLIFGGNCIITTDAFVDTSACHDVNEIKFKALKELANQLGYTLRKKK